MIFIRYTLCLLSGIHAREWISPAVVTYMMRELTENITGQQELVDGLDWYIVPVVNPDGYAYSWSDDRLWRKTRRGEDFSSFLTKLRAWNISITVSE